MTDRWLSKVIPCQGGLVLNIDALSLGTAFPGAASILQNFEPSVSGGYRRLSGYNEFDSAAVPGTTNAPVLGVKVAFDGVFACRLNSTDNAIHFSTGSGWTKVSTTARTGGVTKARFIAYSITEPVVIQCDGVNPAWKWNGTVEATINGTGAPANPKYASIFRDRLALSGYGDGSKLALSAPNDDEEFDGSNGAIEFNVGDTVMGIKLFREELIIFCKNSLKKLIGSTSSDFAIVDVTNSVGCLSGDTIQELAGDLVFVATDTVRSYAATERNSDVNISSVSLNIQPIIVQLISDGYEAEDFSSCCIRKKSQYRIFVNNTDSTTQDNLGILGKVQDAPTVPKGIYEWSTIVGIKPYCADSEFTGRIEISVIGDPQDGKVYRLESGNTFGGINIQAVYRTPDLTFDDATLRKVIHKGYFVTQVEGNLDATVQLLLDREMTGIIQPNPIGLSQQGVVPVYGEAEYGTDVYGAFVAPSFKKNFIGSGMFGAFQFVCNDDSAPFRIDSFQIEYAQKGRR